MKHKIKVPAVILSAVMAVVLIPTVSLAAVPLKIVPVSAGEYGQTFVVKTDSTLWGWGGTSDGLTKPVKIMDNVISAATGSMHCLALKADGSLWGWGDNTYGQLGTGKNSLITYGSGYYTAVPVKIMDSAASMAANGVYSYVVKTDETLWAFGGDRTEFLIGDGTMASTTPVKVMDGVTLISAAGSNVLALKADDSLWMWGDNASGEIGDGTTTAQTRPVKVMDSVLTATMGTFHTLAVKKDGTLWTWGSNYGGALGDGTDKDSTAPVKIMDGVISVAAGTCHSLAVKKDGSLWSWGQGVTGFKGNKGYNLIPEKILENVVFACAKGSANYAVKADGSLWAWGSLTNINSTPYPTEALSSIQAPGIAFVDVAAGAWYYKAVSFIAARGVTDGTGNSKYSPEAKLTRGEFIVMMMKAFCIAPDTNPTDNFSDAGITYYTGYLAAAKRLGISAGIGNNMYAPGKEITRQEMFTLLYNALKVIGQLPGMHGRAVSGADDQPGMHGRAVSEADDQPGGNSSKTLSDFTDAGQIDSWAQDAMTLFVKTGTVSGSNGKLTPTGTTTRAEMAQVLYNLLGK